MRELSPSKQLLVWCLFFVGGLVVGSLTTFDRNPLIYMTIAWGLVYLSKQEPTIELLSLILFAISGGTLLWIATGGESWLHLKILADASNILTGWRDNTVDKIFMSLSEPHGSLLSGIIFGNKVKLSKDLTDQFKIIGVTHLIAVSGYNLTILTANIRSILRPFFGLKTFYLCLIAITGFVLMTGAPASVLRAAVMSGMFLLAEFLGRPSKSLNILIVGATVLIAFQPSIITDIGFQLSLAATYGLLRLTPVLQYSLRKLPIPKMLSSIICETLGATVLTTPIILFYFERLSIISPLANLLILPIVPLLMGLGIFGALALVVYQPIGNGLIMLSWPILQWIVYLSDKLSSLRFASANVSIPMLVFVLVMIMIIAGSEKLFNKLGEIKTDEPKLA